MKIIISPAKKLNITNNTVNKKMHSKFPTSGGPLDEPGFCDNRRDLRRGNRTTGCGRLRFLDGTGTFLTDLQRNQLK